jgi:signal transduction histidine kinase
VFGKIYPKLYFSFVGIFIVTLFIVLFLTARFYGSRIHHEFNEGSLTHARFLLNEYREACGGSIPGTSGIEDCERFLNRIDTLHHVRFWILEPGGKVLLSHEKSPPEFSDSEIKRAAAGEEIAGFSRRSGQRIILPVRDNRGTVRELFVLRGQLLRHREFPRFPLILSLAISGLVIALLVVPLSLRITRPIRHLHHVGQQWAEGHLDHRTKLKGKDEISELGQVFNMMASNLQKMLDEKKEFLAFISHELKSPLARIKLSLDLLSQTSDLEEKSRIEEGMHRDIIESEKLIDQLLTLSRLEMSLPATRLECVDLGSVVQKVVQQLHPVSFASNIKVRTFAGEGGPLVVEGDADQLQRALANVVENAVKFSGPGEEIQIHLSAVNQHVRLQVADEGIGVDPAEAGKIFEPFYRGRLNVDQQGNGLGLFIARRIIELHGGRIEARANQPKGTIISIELPVTAEKT